MIKNIFLLLFVTVQAFGQQNVFKGTLLDAKTKDPVVYVNISFLKTTKGISSTEEGTFLMYINQRYLN